MLQINEHLYAYLKGALLSLYFTNVNLPKLKAFVQKNC